MLNFFGAGKNHRGRGRGKSRGGVHGGSGLGGAAGRGRGRGRVGRRPFDTVAVSTPGNYSLQVLPVFFILKNKAFFSVGSCLFFVTKKLL